MVSAGSNVWRRLLVLGLWAVLGCTTFSLRGQVYLNEILFNPPGNPDPPNEYIEIRGTPNLILSNVYLVSVEGDTNGNTGTIQDVFNLSGRALGGNGFLALLQKTNSYSVNASGTTLINTGSGGGWGSGSSSSIGHRGEGGQVELENGSQTFFLIQTTNPPVIGLDLDTNDDGVIDAPVFASWSVWDSVGVLDNDGVGDIAYGAINFRRNSAALAGGVIVPVTFSPSYVGRTTNSTGSAAAGWVAGDSLGGAAPNWVLGSAANTVPSSFAGAALNHIAAGNFGATAIPGLIALQTGGKTEVTEGSSTDSYTLNLNVLPAGAVTVQIAAGPQLQVSLDSGGTWGATRSVSFANTSPRTILVRASDDNVVDTSPHVRLIRHTVTSTADPARYPLSTVGPTLNVNIRENDTLRLTELKVNPPGDDGACEFVEIQGSPNAFLTNIYFIALTGDAGGDPGTVDLAINLSSVVLGSGGLLLLAAPGHPYAVPPTTAQRLDAKFLRMGGALRNSSVSFLLVSSPTPIVEGVDLDDGDNGNPEGLDPGATVLDSVAWSDGDTNDVLYSEAVLEQIAGTPDAATRFPGDDRPNTADAWFNGDLAGDNCNSVKYDKDLVSAGFPQGTLLTPGVLNNTAPIISPLPALCGTIGDPTNPQVFFAVDDAESGPAALTLTATSSEPAVVSGANLVVSGSGGSRTLTITPTGVGYTTITLLASDGSMTGKSSFRYAASAMGRPGGRFHVGASDGSTAFALDSTWALVGDDEDQAIRLYPRDQSGPAVTLFNFTQFLNLVDLEDGSAREIDLEASTHVGNRIYWIGSHSHSTLGATRTNRSRIFATDLSGSGINSTLAYVGRYEHLRADLLNWDATNGHGRGSNYYGLVASAAEGVEPKAEDGSGFNIEGLCMAPGSTNTAYIAFRAPLVPPTARSRALLVPVTNFASLAVSTGPGGSARFGPPIELSLGCRGVRSIEGGPGGCLIIAGPPGSSTEIAPHDFRLFTWSGLPADPAQLRAAELTGLNPEAIVALPALPWSAQSQVQLVSDNGTTVFYGDGKEAKHLSEVNFKKFRTDWVAFGDVVPGGPAIVSQNLVGTNLTIRWCAEPGRSYRVLFTDNVMGMTWVAVPGDVVAVNTLASKTAPVVQPGQRFYRVMLLP